MYKRRPRPLSFWRALTREVEIKRLSLSFESKTRVDADLLAACDDAETWCIRYAIDWHVSRRACSGQDRLEKGRTGIPGDATRTNGQKVSFLTPSSLGPTRFAFDKPAPFAATRQRVHVLGNKAEEKRTGLFHVATDQTIVHRGPGRKRQRAHFVFTAMERKKKKETNEWRHANTIRCDSCTLRKKKMLGKKRQKKGKRACELQIQEVHGQAPTAALWARGQVRSAETAERKNIRKHGKRKPGKAQGKKNTKRAQRTRKKKETDGVFLASMTRRYGKRKKNRGIGRWPAAEFTRSLAFFFPASCRCPWFFSHTPTLRTRSAF